MDELINTFQIEEAKKLIKKAKKPVIVRAQDYEFNRKIMEYGKFDVLLFPSFQKFRRSLRFIDSGLDLTSLNSAFKNKISIGINLKELRRLSLEKRALMIEGLIKNIILCRKAKVNIIPLAYKDEKDAFSLLLSLGISTINLNKSIGNLFNTAN